MCFHIHQDHPDKKVADSNILCYKVLLKRRARWPWERRHPDIDPAWSYYLSPFQAAEPWKFGVIVKDHVNDIPNYGTIYGGLHSFSDIKIAAEYTSGHDLKRRRIMEAVIPKGSSYYYNPERNEYVSDQLVIMRVSNMSWWYKILGNF